MPLFEEEELNIIKRGLSWVFLKKALLKTGCPICMVMEEALTKYLESILYEYALDGSVHSKMIKSFGLCNIHTWKLKEAEESLNSDGLSVASVMETTLNKEIKILNSLSSIEPDNDKVNKFHLFKRANPVKKFIDSAIIKLSPTEACAACGHQIHTESFYAHELIRLSKDAEFKALYENQNILMCRIHFNMLIKELLSEDQIHYFVGAQQTKLEKLSHSISEFIRKHDYRLIKKLNDEDKNSWMILLEHLGSKKNIDRVWSDERKV
jgi:hypothetical protein